MKTKQTAEDAAALSARLALAREDAVIAAAAVDAGEAAYREGLLTETPATLRKLADAKTDASIAVDRAAALVAKLEADVANAVQNEAETRRRDQYAAANVLADAARKQLREAYLEAAEKIRGVLRVVAEADIAVDAANENLPEGQRAIAKPDSTRSLPNLPEEVISEETVQLWTHVGDSNPLPDDQQEQVDRHGRIRVGRNQFDCTLRKFVRKTSLPPVFGRLVLPLAAEINLPGLSFGEGALWRPASSASDALRQLDAPRRPAAIDPERVPVVTYQLVRNP